MNQEYPSIKITDKESITTKLLLNKDSINVAGA